MRLRSAGLLLAFVLVLAGCATPPQPPVALATDFAAAKAASGSEPAPQVASAPVPAASSAFPPAPAQAPKAEGFDAIFLPQASTSTVPQPAAPAPVPAPVQAESSRPFSFDDAFGATSATVTDSTLTHQQSSSDATSQTSTPFPTSMPSSPIRETGSIGSRRSMSPPPREISPPPRQSSKSRPSTASSDKEKPTRTSKLSVSRFCGLLNIR